jgi:hypothetical protein
MTYKFYIEGKLVQNPDNFSEFEEKLIRDEEKRHLYYDYPLDLTFTGNGYEILNQQYLADYNSQVELRVDKLTNNGNETLIRTNIKMSNCTFNLSRRFVQCEIDDLTYQSFIFNNYKVKVAGTTEVSKNGVTLSNPVTPTYLTFFEPTDGSNFAATRRCIDVKDHIKAVISYITDETVSFESDWYDNLDDDKKLAITLGSELRLNSDERDPLVSLESIFDNLWKKFNLYLIIENPLINPVIRLEKEDYLTSSSNTITLRNLDNVERSMDYDKLYGRIVVGSNDYIRDYGATYTLPYLQLLGFSEEEYNIGGVIGVDNELDLVSSFIIDQNLLEDIIDNNNDDYDEEVIMVQYDASTNICTKGTYWENGTARYYNEELLNSNVLSRFRYLGNVILDTSQNNQGFQAQNTTPIVASGLVDSTFITVADENPWQFQDDSTGDNYDAGANYNITTYKYTVPNDGIYRFRYLQPFFTSANSVDLDIRGTAKFKINGTEQDMPEFIRVVNPTGLEQSILSDQWQLVGYPISINTETYNFILEQTLVCQAGDEIEVVADFEVKKIAIIGGPESYNITFANGLFLSVQTSLDGGIFESTNPDQYYIGLYSAQLKHLTDEQWRVIREDPTTKIRFDIDGGDYRFGFVKEISRNFITGETEFDILFNREQTNL